MPRGTDFENADEKICVFDEIIKGCIEKGVAVAAPLKILEDSIDKTILYVV